MNWVQWLGVGILVIVTAILVVDTVTWLMHRPPRPRGSAELPETKISSRLYHDTIDAVRDGDKQSAQSEAPLSGRLEHPEDVRDADVLSHSTDCDHRVRWITFGIAGRLRHSFRHSNTSDHPCNGDQR